MEAHLLFAGDQAGWQVSDSKSFRTGYITRNTCEENQIPFQAANGVWEGTWHTSDCGGCQGRCKTLCRGKLRRIKMCKSTVVRSLCTALSGTSCLEYCPRVSGDSKPDRCEIVSCLMLRSDHSFIGRLQNQPMSSLSVREFQGFLCSRF